MKQPDNLELMRHSLAHIMAAAIQKLWPKAKFGVGPVVEDGFYYDVDIAGTKISEADFPRIEEEMARIIKESVPFTRQEMPIDEAITWAKDNKQPYKQELLNDLKRSGTTVFNELESSEAGKAADKPAKVDTVTFYTSSDFTDLCRGPHIKNSDEVGVYKLLRVAGAYWRGKETNPQMQRLYGVAFATKEKLNEYLNMLDEAKKRDHRKLGQELDLIIFSELVGSGLPLFTPKGTILREELARFSNELREIRGFNKVWSPHITKIDLYKTSGHWDKFGNELFLVKSQETSDHMVLKPMNCPHHIQIYDSKPRSYRDLPVKMLETSTVYRDEKSGEMHGLSRVRSITMDDSHVFCRQDQISEVTKELIDAAKEMYLALGMELRFRLSFRDDSDAYLGGSELWDKAQQLIEEAAKQEKLNFFISEGDAAFYGPKIDFIATDALGRDIQVATVQLDFIQPERFNLKYTDEQGESQVPVMIHCALLGSIERFLGVYIEHTAGRFPVWLAPEQIRLLTVNQTADITGLANKMLNEAKQFGLRVTADVGNESVGKKIRQAETMKIPYIVVLGEKELESSQVTPRIRQDIQVQPASQMTIANFMKTVANEAKTRVKHSSL